MKRFKFPRRFFAFLGFAFANAFIFGVMRVIFCFVNKSADDIAPNLIARAFAVGGRFDLRIAFLFALPLGILFLLPYKKWYKKTFAALYTFAFSAFILVYFIDFGYYSYLSTRLDAYIFALAAENMTSLEMVWQSYPVIKAALLLFVLAAIYFLAVRKFFNWVYSKTEPGKNYWYALPALLMAAFFVYGRLAQYPLRWSNAYFNPNPFVSSLALNPVQNVFDTYAFAKKGEGFDEAKTREYYDIAAAYLGVKNQDKQNLNFTRDIPAAPGGPQKYNVVIILVESLAFDKTSFSAPAIDPTPELTALAKRGTLFNNFFTPAVGTARGVFTAITGLPDTTTVETASRNPRLVKQHSLVNDLTGYGKFYFIGGSASWGNVRGLLQNNIEGLEIIEEDAYKTASRADVWGVSDLDMMRYAAAEIKETQKPFFAFIQTAGFHRPYTIPKDRGTFEIKNIDDDILKSYGFSGGAEFNSMRFQDYAVGEFFRLIENEKFFENTIFFILGDHGLTAQGAKHTPKIFRDLSMEEYNVPLLVIGPGAGRDVVNPRAASQADITATMAGLLGMPYKATAIGHNIFDKNNEEGAFILRSSAAPLRIGFVQDGFYYTYWPGRQGMFKYDGGGETDYCPQHPKRCEDMARLTRAVYETARYITYHH